MPDRRSSADAYLALVARIASINGASGGYWTDLTDRVYKRFWEPETERSEYPYACVPLIDPAAQGDDADTPFHLLSWVQPVFIFVAQTMTSETDSITPELVLKAHDDVLKALATDWKLGNTVQSCSIVARAFDTDSEPEMRYGALRIDIRLNCDLPLTLLGP